MGWLEIHGTLSVKQFWPSGTSDADTAKVTVSGGKGAVVFEGHPTQALVHAVVAGKPAISSHGQVTVRLQGIDAPELHYRPHFKNRTRAALNEINHVNADFRQPFGETAAMELGAFLADAGRDPMPCVVRSNVSEPGDRPQAKTAAPSASPNSSAASLPGASSPRRS